MRLLLILSACLLVGCGDEYSEIEDDILRWHIGKIVEVKQTGQNEVLGEFHEFTKKMVILEQPSGNKISIPRSKIIRIIHLDPDQEEEYFEDFLK
jgi:hypothetical protein